MRKLPHSDEPARSVAASQRADRFLQAKLKWDSALGIAQSWNVGDANTYPKADHGGSRYALIDEWRAALVAQMLTPAPDMGAVRWKQGKLVGDDIRRTDANLEKLRRAIAADLEWLAAHPTRKSKPMSAEAKQQRRKFKEAMRQRIRDIAASRDIPDDEIRPVLSLRHHLVGEFAEKYNVSLDWLLGRP